MSKPVGDMKAGLTSGARPKLSINGKHAAIYQCRGTEYGADKYARGNYHGPAPEGVTPEARIMGYIDAIMRHCTEISDAYNRALGTGGDARAAIALPDSMASGGFPASMLPHLAHILAGAGIAVECAVADGLVPADPGQPWKAGAREVGLPQKDDPAAERARVAALANPRMGDDYTRPLQHLADEVAAEFRRPCEIDAACDKGCTFAEIERAIGSEVQS